MHGGITAGNNRMTNNKMIEELQLIEQNMQNLILQRQNFQTQMIEAENALTEVSSDKTSDKAVYKIIGNIMIKTGPAKIKQELESKKEMLDIRIKNIEKQEEMLKNRASRYQKEIIGGLKDKDD